MLEQLSNLELREAVAREIMEWQTAVIGCVQQKELAYAGVWVLPENLPAYESDIADAWQIIGKMESQGFLWVISKFRNVVQVSFSPTAIGFGVVGGNYSSYGDTVAEAVCRAALAAMRATKEGVE